MLLTLFHIPIQKGLIQSAMAWPFALLRGDHRSFDAGLLYVLEDYSIQVNPAKVSYLERIGRADGLEQYIQQLRNELLLPPEYNWHPAPDNLILANVARGVGLEG